MTLTVAPFALDEIALYDRQIRLWGVQAQQKIRNAHILLVNVKALGNEVAKNLVLAGIASLTLVDNGIVTEDDLCAQFFLTEADIGQPVRRAPAQSPHRANTNKLTQAPPYSAPKPQPSTFARSTRVSTSPSSRAI